MYELAPDVTRDFVLERLTQEQIMEYYLGCKIHLKKRFCSPLRKDDHPSCGFFYNKEGTLIFNDFAGHFSGGCFKVVMHMHNCSFGECLARIAEDFGLLSGTPIPRKEYPQIDKEKVQTVIDVKRRPWDSRDRDFWTQYGITKATLELFRVAPVSTVWINGTIVYTDSKYKPAYVYDFGHGNRKIYLPFSTGNRFYCNCNVVQGSNIFQDYSEGVVITKSLKDVMVLHELGITAVAPQSETVYPDPDYIASLFELAPTVVTLYDFDRAGVTMANHMRKKYGIPALFFTDGRFGTKDYGGKDISDVVKARGKYAVQQLVYLVYGNYCNGGDTSVHHPREDEQLPPT